MSDGSRQIIGIQVLRAVAALAVAVEHASSEIAVSIGVKGFPVVLIGAFGVDLFFVISGFVMVYSTAELRGAGAPLQFAARRLIRIVPLYWLITTVLLAYLVARHVVELGAIGPDVIGSYFFIPYRNAAGQLAPILGVGWTLNYEMFFYAAFAVILAFPWRRTAVLCLAVALVIFGNIGVFRGHSAALEFWLSPIITEFALGMAVAVIYVGGYRLPPVGAVLVFGVGAAWLVAAAFHDWTAASRVYGYGVPSALLVWGGLAMPARRWLVPLAVIGDISYSLYLTHALAFSLPRDGGWAWIAPLHPWLYAAGIFVLALVVAAGSYFFFERPATRVLVAWWRMAPGRRLSPLGKLA